MSRIRSARTLLPTLFSALAGGFALLAMAACQLGDGSGLSGMGNTKKVWKVRSVRVCWSGGPQAVPPAVRTTVRDAVSREFNGRTQISFTGWEPCKKGGEGDVDLVLVRYEGGSDDRCLPPSGSEGFTFDDEVGRLDSLTPGVGGTLPLNVEAGCGCIARKLGGALDVKACAEFMALHDFGHVAGLFHEHDHVASTCRYRKQEKVDAAQTGGTPLGLPYDPASVMDYCRRDEFLTSGPRPGDARLSQGDVETIVRLYPTPTPLPTVSVTAPPANSSGGASSTPTVMPTVTF